MAQEPMRGLAGTSRVALAVAAFLASLSLVSWRQREALDTMAALDSLRQELALEVSTLEELESRILHLESWGRVVPEAERRLGMRKAGASDIVYLPGEAS
jgi:cell division protein FtsL